MPAKATGIEDAKYALCVAEGVEYYLDFGRSNLYRDNFGMTAGTLGAVQFGYRAAGSVAAFTTTMDSYPVLFVNGPSTTISAQYAAMNTGGLVKTYNFVTGTGELKSNVATKKGGCELYVGPVYP
jgi:hypothetical protein